jgi:hypothetical protein
MAIICSEARKESARGPSRPCALAKETGDSLDRVAAVEVGGVGGDLAGELTDRPCPRDAYRTQEVGGSTPPSSIPKYLHLFLFSIAMARSGGRLG